MQHNEKLNEKCSNTAATHVIATKHQKKKKEREEKRQRIHETRNNVNWMRLFSVRKSISVYNNFTYELVLFRFFFLSFLAIVAFNLTNKITKLNYNIQE